jgi:hypothetical protein
MFELNDRLRLKRNNNLRAEGDSGGRHADLRYRASTSGGRRRGRAHGKRADPRVVFSPFRLWHHAARDKRSLPP